MSRIAYTKKLTNLYYSRCPVPSPLTLAMQLGWLQQKVLQKHNINISTHFETPNPTDFQQHLSDVPINFLRQGGSVPSIWARANNQDTCVLGVTWTDEYQTIIALPQSGILSAKDLRGRRIGIPKYGIEIDHARATALRGFSVILETEGMTLQDVEIVDLPDYEIPTIIRDGQIVATGKGRRGSYAYSSEIDAISNRTVDAVYVKDVRGAQATHLLGARVVSAINKHPDEWVRANNCTPRPLTVNRWLVRNRPDLVEDLLQQIFLAGVWANQNPNETRKLISREIGWQESWVKYAYGENLHQHLRLSLDANLLKHLNTFKNFLFEHKFIEHNFSLNDWVIKAPLQKIINASPRVEQYLNYPTDQQWLAPSAV